MNRNTFLKACMVAGTFLYVPYNTIANTIRKLWVEKGFKVDSGKDRFDQSISLFEGDTFTTKVSANDTSGDIYVYESIRVKEGGPAYHLPILKSYKSVRYLIYIKKRNLIHLYSKTCPAFTRFSFTTS